LVKGVKIVDNKIKDIVIICLYILLAVELWKADNLFSQNTKTLEKIEGYLHLLGNMSMSGLKK
jgi:hypothetical protein